MNWKLMVMWGCLIAGNIFMWIDDIKHMTCFLILWLAIQMLIFAEGLRSEIRQVLLQLFILETQVLREKSEAEKERLLWKRPVLEIYRLANLPEIHELPGFQTWKYSHVSIYGDSSDRGRGPGHYTDRDGNECLETGGRAYLREAIERGVPGMMQTFRAMDAMKELMKPTERKEGEQC